MRTISCRWSLVVLALCVSGTKLTADTGTSTRIANPQHHAYLGGKTYVYRQKADYILKELDLKSGDVVVDVGCGDGWWTERMARHVGERGAIFAGEINGKKVEGLKKKFAHLPQIKPFQCAADSTTLPENCCDLAFFSQTYHHLNQNGHTDYLKHLRKVIKPTGRVCIIERYSHIGMRRVSHGTNLSKLTREAEAAGWVPVRCELMTGTNHYIAILVQEDLFPAKSPAQKTVTGNRKVD